MASGGSVRRPRVLQSSLFAPSMQALVESRFDVVVSESGYFDESLVGSGPFDALLVHEHPVVDGEVLDRFPVRVVSNFGVGVDHIAVEECSRRGVWATNTPGAMVETTADLAVALLLAGARNLVAGHAVVREGREKYDPTWFGKEVWGSKVGVLGYGRIGKAVGRRMEGFGCVLGYHKRTRLPLAQEAEEGVEWKESVEEIARWSDFLVLALPATCETEKIVDAAVIAAMPPGAVLVNIARGSVVDQEAVVAALESNHLKCYATDVTSPEPLPKDHPLLSLPPEKFICTPHMGSATLRTRTRMLNMALDNLQAACEGKVPPNALNNPQKEKGEKGDDEEGEEKGGGGGGEGEEEE